MQKLLVLAVVSALSVACGPAPEPEPEPIEGLGEFDVLVATTDRGTYRVELEPSVDPITVAAFDLTVRVQTANPGPLPADLSLAVDSFMPVDGHGFLDGPPTVSGGEGGVFAVEEIILNHGNLEWELYFDVSASDESERATFVVIPKARDLFEGIER